MTINLKIMGFDYGSQNHLIKVLLTLLYPFIIFLTLGIVLIIALIIGLIIFAILIPCLFFVWLLMFIGIFKKRKRVKK